MTPSEIRKDLDRIEQELRDYIYTFTDQHGTLVEETEDEVAYKSLKVQICLESSSFGTSSLDKPWISEIRAYLGEGWLDIQIEGESDVRDIDDLSTEERLDIVEYLR